MGREFPQCGGGKVRPTPPMLAPRALVKGETTALDEPPLFCEQTLDSRERVMLCPQCGAAAAPLHIQLSLAVRSARRKALISLCNDGAWASVPGWEAEPERAEVCGGGCDEAWCSARCRQLHQQAHQFTCLRHAPDAHPISELHYMGRKVSETLLLAAKAICGRIAAALSRGADGLQAAAEMEAARLLAACAAPQVSAPQQAPRENSPQVQMDGRGDSAVRAAEESWAEAWCLLHAALTERLPPCALAPLSPLLDRRIYVTAVSSFERLLLPLEVDSPIVERCAELSATPDPGADPAFTPLLQAAQAMLSAGRQRLSGRNGRAKNGPACGPISGPTGRGAPMVSAAAGGASRCDAASGGGMEADAEADAEAQLDALLLAEAIAAASEAAADPDSRPDGLQEGGQPSQAEAGSAPQQARPPLAPLRGGAQQMALRIAAVRRAGLLHHRAASLFAPARGQFVFLPAAGAPPHSCLPAAQFEPAPLPPLTEGHPAGEGGWSAPAVGDGGSGSVAAVGGDNTDIPSSARGPPFQRARKSSWRRRGWTVGVVALRDVRAGDPLTVAWVDAAAPFAERRRQLRARFGAMFDCLCAKCAFEGSGAVVDTDEDGAGCEGADAVASEGAAAIAGTLLATEASRHATDTNTGTTTCSPPSITASAITSLPTAAPADMAVAAPPNAAAARRASRPQLLAPAARLPWLDLAIAAVQEGRFGDAVVLSRRQLRVAGGADGEASHLLGAAHLAMGDVISAREAWRAGAAADPTHAGLAATWSKCQKYALADDTVEVIQAQAEHADSGAGDPRPLHDATRLWLDPLELPGSETLLSRNGARVVCSSGPLLSPAECDACVALAEARASSLGGWTTSRHYAVPTTDLPVHESDALLGWFTRAFRGRIAPWLEAHMHLPVGALAVHDAFVIKYSAAAQRLLPMHIDESALSFTLPLNRDSEYDGGGTYFGPLGRSVRPPMGSLIAFHGGRILHGGEPVIRGTRYVLAAFLYERCGPVRGECGGAAAPPETDARGIKRGWAATVGRGGDNGSREAAAYATACRRRTAFESESGCVSFSFGFGGGDTGGGTDDGGGGR